MAEEKLRLILQELVRRSNDDNRRIRSLEQQIEAMENKVKNIEDSFLKEKKHVADKLINNEASIRNINEDIMRLNTSTERLSKKLDKTASKRELEEVEKMFDLLSPLKQEFVTKDSLEEEVQEEVEDYLEKEKERIRIENSLRRARSI
jgi:seryl-tRNA synthetase